MEKRLDIQFRVNKVRLKQYKRSAVLILIYLRLPDWYLERIFEGTVGEAQKSACIILNYYTVSFTRSFLVLHGLKELNCI